MSMRMETILKCKLLVKCTTDQSKFTNILVVIILHIFYTFLKKYLCKLENYEDAGKTILKDSQKARKNRNVVLENAGKYGPEKTPYLDTFHTVDAVRKGCSGRL